MAIKIQLPLTKEKVMSLKAGDSVLLSGTMYIARDAAHKKIVELINSGKPIPLDLKDATIYYAGPAPTMPGQVINSVGPTSSYRMDPYAVQLLSLGLSGMVGKGPRNQDVKDALVKYKAVYFTAVGGAAALVAKTIVKHEVLAFEELGAEALRKIEVVDFPVFVGDDAYGKTIIIEREE